MKLIIDIPDYSLEEVQNGSIASSVILKAVKNGTPINTEGDLISRSALKEEILKKRGLSWESMQNIFCITGKELDNAPTVEPEKAKEGELVKAYTKGFDVGVKTVRSQGEWVKMSDRFGFYFACNKCGYDRAKSDNANFCPNCGAIMTKGGAE